MPSLRADVAVFDVEFHQRLGMLRDEGDRHHHDRDALMGGALDLGLGAGCQPRLGRHPRLVADHPVEIGHRQRVADGIDGTLDLELVRVAGADDRSPAGRAPRTARAAGCRRAGWRAPFPATRAAAARWRRHRRRRRASSRASSPAPPARPAPPPRARHRASCPSWWSRIADRAAAAARGRGGRRVPHARRRR